MDPTNFRTVVGRFATGVTVMTTVADGEIHGMTANAVSSVSLDPVLVLVCVERSTVMHDLVQRAGVFALSILAQDQRPLSERFADPGRPVGEAMFEGVSWDTATTGAPVLQDALGYVDCEVWKVHDGGDHSIVVGEVVDVGTFRDAPPLVYFRSAYGTTGG